MQKNTNWKLKTGIFMPSETTTKEEEGISTTIELIRSVFIMKIGIVIWTPIMRILMVLEYGRKETLQLELNLKTGGLK